MTAFFVAWARSTQQSLGALVRRRWPLAVALGLLVAAVLSVMVLRTEDATARPDGLELAGAVLWRGVVYGATDGLVLSAFPILAVGRGRRRWRLPTLVTLNPLGAPIAHVGLHVSAVLHSYETDVFLPPHD